MLVVLVVWDSTPVPEIGGTVTLNTGPQVLEQKKLYPVVSAHSLSLQHHADNGVLSGRAMKWVATYPINQLKRRKIHTTDTAGYLQESHNVLRVSWLSGIDYAAAAVLHHPSGLGCKQLGTFNKVGPLCESA